MDFFATNPLIPCTRPSQCRHEQNEPFELIDWNQIDTLLLDMDGTLLDLHFDDHFWLQFMPSHLPEAHGFDAEKMHSHFHAPMQSTRGTLDWYCVDRWKSRLNIPVMQAMSRHRHLIRWRPGTTDFLRLARKAGKQILIATNAHPEVWQLKADTLDLARFVDAVVTSHDYGQPKEDGHFWASLVNEHALDLGRCAFFDDSEAVLASAVRHGVGTVVGIDRPNSSRPTRDMSHPLNIRDFSDLIPGLAA